MLDLLYSHLARARRRYYTRRPHLRRRLASPVISVGNLTVGGSGKTPIAAAIARVLMQMGERPAILSRGYARRVVEDGVVVVSDGERVMADEARSGDEPQMLARALPGTAVLVSASRYAAGRLAETRMGCTVHILDDGFQHFDLIRDTDLLVLPDEGDGDRTLPGGRLREPLDAAAAADAFLIEEGRPANRTLAPGRPVFEFVRRVLAPAPDRPAFAFAGIARPERFFSDLERAGWRLTGRRAFRDHHHYSRADLDAIAREARQSGAEVALTTEKDLVRFQPPPAGPAIVAVPLEVDLDAAFPAWLAARLRAGRA